MRIQSVDRVIDDINIPINLQQSHERQVGRILAQETSHRRVIVPGAQTIQSGQRIKLLAGVQIGIDGRAGLGVAFPKGSVGIGVGNRAQIIAQRAHATLSVVQVVVRHPAAGLRDQFRPAQHVAGQRRTSAVRFQQHVAVRRELIPQVVGDLRCHALPDAPPGGIVRISNSGSIRQGHAVLAGGATLPAWNPSQSLIPEDMSTLDKRTFFWNEPSLYYENGTLYLIMVAFNLKNREDISRDSVYIFATEPDGLPSSWQWEYKGELVGNMASETLQTACVSDLIEQLFGF